MDYMRLLNIKRLLSLFVGVLMIGTVSLTTFNASSSTCVSYADDDMFLGIAEPALKTELATASREPNTRMPEPVYHVVRDAVAGALVGAVEGAARSGGNPAVIVETAVERGLQAAAVGSTVEVIDQATGH